VDGHRSLSLKRRDALTRVLVRRREVVWALFVPDGERPVLVFESGERPDTVEDARRNIQDLVAAVAPVLESRAAGIGFSAGGPEDVATFAAGAKVGYERR
jgi:hypothetical protein